LIKILAVSLERTTNFGISVGQVVYMYGTSPVYLRLDRVIMIVIAKPFLIVFWLELRQTGCLVLKMKTLPFIELGGDYLPVSTTTSHKT